MAVDKPDWRGVFPAVTTQFREDFSVDVEATGRVISALVDDGVSGLIIGGTVGENTSLTMAEKVGLREVAAARAAGPVGPQHHCAQRDVAAGVAHGDYSCAARKHHGCDHQHQPILSPCHVPK